jgi:hypothetical protein
MATRMSIAAVVFLLCVSYAVGGEQLGVTVYPGATYDLVMTTVLKKTPSIEGAAYLTDAAMAEVMEFYRKEGLLLLRLGDATKERARFKKTDTGVDVILQNPWKDPRTGATMKGTLIMIIQGRE